MFTIWVALITLVVGFSLGWSAFLWYHEPNAATVRADWIVALKENKDGGISFSYSYPKRLNMPKDWARSGIDLTQYMDNPTDAMGIWTIKNVQNFIDECCGEDEVEDEAVHNQEITVEPSNSI